MTTTEPLELLRRIIDAYDHFKAAELDVPPHELEPFRATLAETVRAADALVGRRKERGPIPLGRSVPPGGGWV